MSRCVVHVANRPSRGNRVKASEIVSKFEVAELNVFAANEVTRSNQADGNVKPSEWTGGRQADKAVPP